jgi:hypothetical protein
MPLFQSASVAVTGTASEITGEDPNQTVLFGEVPDVPVVDEIDDASTDNQIDDVDVPDLDIEPDTDHTFGPDDI